MATELDVSTGGQFTLPWQTAAGVCTGQDFRILLCPAWEACNL